jgi:hypothetical protein
VLPSSESPSAISQMGKDAERHRSWLFLGHAPFLF